MKTAEQKAKDAEYRRRRWAATTPEQRSRLAAYQRTWSATPEQKLKRANRQRARYATTEGKARQAAYSRAYKYGLTISDFDAMFAQQNGLCASCKLRPATDTDHDHGTNVVRELLCHQCNLAEGLLGGLEGARMLVTYLERHNLVAAA